MSILSDMLKIRISAFLILAVSILLGYFVYSTHIDKQSKFPFKLGLDLSGGTHLVYKADVSNIKPADVPEAMSALRDTLEKRINLFGVAEPIVQVEQGGALSGKIEQRLIIELPGIEDTKKAIEMIGKTPVLEFRMKKDKPKVEATASSTITLDINSMYDSASITGAHLKRASVAFGGTSAGLSNEPVVQLQFNDKGKEIFAKMTKENVGKIFGIFLDGRLISAPVIREAIPNGKAIISGNFKPTEARELVRNLNLGALPVPIELLSSQTIGASLGKDTLAKGIKAGVYGFAMVLLFLLLWYRLPGLIAGISLSIYVIIMLALFKFLGITITAAGLAGFILSIGMAVDANVLIFERMKEELNEGKWTHNAIKDGFARAWLAIRDGNLSSLITAVILFWFGTSMVEGFALVFGLGVIVSMFTALTVSRTLLLALGDYENNKIVRFLYKSGIK